MPKKVLTKRGKEFLVRIFKRVGGHVLGYAFLILVIILGYTYIENRFLKGRLDQSTVLKDNEQRKAIIDFRRKTLTTVQRDEDDQERQTVHNFSGLRKATIIEDMTGKVRINAPTRGFILEPGYTAFVSNSRPHMGLDLQWFYWRRFGLSSGIGLGPRRTEDRGEGEADTRWAGYPIALNYNLPLSWAPNTNLFLGATNDKRATGGMSVKW